jgi:hypothetical protein
LLIIAMIASKVIVALINSIGVAKMADAASFNYGLGLVVAAAAIAVAAEGIVVRIKQGALGAR